jgi:hypothetical protein
MAGYFSFQRMITPSFVKAIYAVGFVAITVAGVSLIVWAGLRLHDANIGRQQGWQFVALGATAVIIGNLIWRIFCEFWVVFFNIHSYLASIYDRVNLNYLRPQTVVMRANKQQEEAPTDFGQRESESYQPARTASVLGLS